MHEGIALNGCECMFGKSTLRLVLIGWARLNGTMSNGVTRKMKMVNKICARYKQEGIDPPSSERSANYGQT